MDLSLGVPVEGELEASLGIQRAEFLFNFEKM